MAGLRDIKLRIKSVNNTMQITKAMNLIATVKLKKARDRMESFKPYSEEFVKMFNDAACSYCYQNRYFKEVKGNRVLFIVIASDRGLCGSYNTAVIRKAVTLMEGMEPHVIAVGIKARDFFKKREYNVVGSYADFIENASIADIEEVAKIIIEKYDSGQVDEVQLVYTEFVSSIHSQPVSEKLLPIDNPSRDSGKEEFTFEPSAESVFDFILPKYISSRLKFAFVNSSASEQSSRMIAMSAATENAGKLIDELTLHYNRARQASITNEISEIVGGTEALK